MILDRRVVVISDIHANAVAFQAGLALARCVGFDELIMLGDLLTYGCQVQETIAIAEEAASRDKAKFVLGNHDEIYFRYAAGELNNYRHLPPWIQESVEWTVARLGDGFLHSISPWLQRIELTRALFAHANPFEYGDWTYLNTAPRFEQAVATLRAGANSMGIFGHTHRHFLFISSHKGDEIVTIALDAELALVFDESTTVAVTISAIGQPRDAPPASSIFIAEPTRQGISLRRLAVHYNHAAHLDAIVRSGMSPGTVSKLQSYFK